MDVLLATLVLRIGSAPSVSGYPGVVSGALALYGYPLVVMGIAISLVILLSQGWRHRLSGADGG